MMYYGEIFAGILYDWEESFRASTAIRCLSGFLIEHTQQGQLETETFLAR